jgi:pyruvate/2-oxoglutarate dehydrogenase complex dihydrolipoamide dehydrogenase (E3) component
VIGASQGGRFLTVEMAKASQKVALVERDQVGGVTVLAESQYGCQI